MTQVNAMNALTQKLVAAVKDEEFKTVIESFFEFCAYLDIEKHAVGDGDLATAFAASLQRRGKTYEIGCGMLNVALRR
jgi:hypothetical protein